jgi:hypothetical protein
MEGTGLSQFETCIGEMQKWLVESSYDEPKVARIVTIWNQLELMTMRIIREYVKLQKPTVYHSFFRVIESADRSDHRLRLNIINHKI